MRRLSQEFPLSWSVESLHDTSSFLPAPAVFALPTWTDLKNRYHPPNQTGSYLKTGLWWFLSLQMQGENAPIRGF